MEPLQKIGVPRYFGFRALVQEYALQIPASLVPFIVPLAALVPIFTDVVPARFAPLLLLLGGCGMIILYACFMPLIQVNPFIQRIVNRVAGPKAPDAIAYDCQLTLSPRLCRGIRAFLEDADDVGRLEVTAEAVHFTGDRIQIVLPFESISAITQTRCDWCNFWAAGRKTRITTSAFADIEYIEIGEREARTYFSSKRISTEIHYAIACGNEVSREA